VASAESPEPGVVVGLDNGGTANNATVMTPSGEFLVNHLVEVPSRVTEGPEIAVNALVDALDAVLTLLGLDRSEVRAVGLDTPGPASADGVISSRDPRISAIRAGVGLTSAAPSKRSWVLPVVYNNDGNAAALYAHVRHYGLEAPLRSSVSAIVGTGLGGGLVEAGRVVKGGAGMAGELGHVLLPTEGAAGRGSASSVVQLRSGR
jgi:predicted NBD/HSP70 family sugar kinase